MEFEPNQSERKKNVLALARAKLFQRQQAYLIAFRTELAKQVLADLALFCRADSTTFHENPRAHALMEGRREVYLRIQDHLKLGGEALWQKYK